MTFYPILIKVTRPYFNIAQKSTAICELEKKKTADDLIYVGAFKPIIYHI